MAATYTPTCFGKVPTYGDFIGYNVGGGTNALDKWIQRGLNLAQRQQAGQIHEALVRVPAYNFLFTPRDASAVLFGGIRLSQDNGGRKYPFFVALEAERGAFDARSVPAVPVQFGAFLDHAARFVQEATAGHLTREEIARRLAGLSVAEEPGRLQTYEQYLKQTPFKTFAASLWGHSDDPRKYVLFKNLLDLLGPLRGHVHPQFSLGMKFPLAPGGPSHAFAVSFWLEVCMRILDFPNVAPTFFWTAPGAQAASPFLLIFLQPPSGEAYLHVLPVDSDDEKLYVLDQAGTAPAALAPAYRALLASEEHSLKHVIDTLERLAQPGADTSEESPNPRDSKARARASKKRSRWFSFHRSKDEAMPDAQPSETMAPVVLPLAYKKVQDAISDAHPGGVEDKNDEDYAVVTDQLSSLRSKGTADFGLIIQHAPLVLSKKWKDLRMAYALALALTHVEKVAGLADGLAVIRVLIESFWDTLYPRDLDKRQSSLDRLKAEANALLKDYPVQQADRESLVTALEHLNAIQAYFNEALGKRALNFRGLRETLERKISRLPDPDAPKASVEAPRNQEPAHEEPTPSPVIQESAPKQIGSSPSTMGESRAAPDRTPKTAREAQRYIILMAAELREQNPKDPTPYRVIRTILWDNLQMLPLEDEKESKHRTRLHGPSETQKERIKILSGESLVREAEKLIQENPLHLWLDLQRMVVQSLDFMGDGYRRVQEAVLKEFAELMRRCPWVSTLTFQDDTPFADAETRDFIKTRVLPVSDGGDRAPVVQAPAGDIEAVKGLFEKAKVSLRTESASQALAVMHENVAQDTTAQDRFYRRFYLAKLCMRDERLLKMARPLLEGLDQEITRHELDTWDPALTRDVWQTLHTCYTMAAAQANEPNKAVLQNGRDHIFGKICQLDARYAFSVLNEQG